ncbi:MAG: glycerol-3-phosphate dehydrogenase [Desulfobacca sp. 4484_104]|nr:MAG: glycerol-3-phosphate dehydrogenase [Desulfobacca sp. 4484_104]
MRSEPKTVAIIGAGSWGTALAQHLGSKGISIRLWVFEPELLASLQDRHENLVFLPGVKLSRHITFTDDLGEAVTDQHNVIMAVPSHVYRQVLTSLAPHLSPGVTLVSATKGIETDSLLTMEGLVREVLGPETAYAVLSGPSFAVEVANRQPTAVTVASRSRPVATRIQRLFSSPYLRVYSSYDVTGVELGGALKNVMALGAGILEGLGLSRNYQVGLQLGQGKKLAEILKDMQMVAEGLKTAGAAYHLARKLGVEMPIVEQMYRILYEDHSPQDAIKRLMTRELKDEIDAISLTW